MLDLLIKSTDQSPRQRSIMPDPKPYLIQKAVLASIREICAVSDEACAALDKHPKRNEFAKKLVKIASFPGELQLDAIIIIGDLSSSE